VELHTGRGLDRFLERRGALRRGVEATLEAGPIALQGWQDLAPDADPRVSGVGVGGILEGHDSAATQEVDYLVPPDRQQWTDEEAATRGHAAKAGEPTPPHEVQDYAFHDVVGGVRQGDDVGRRAGTGSFEEVVPQGAGRRLY
jgi:hypothetical protein